MKEYKPSPLDGGLTIIAIGSLMPYLALIQFPVLIVYGPLSGGIFEGTLLQTVPPAPEWTREISALEYDPIVTLLPIVLLVLAITYRITTKTWCYWTLLVFTVVAVVGELSFLGATTIFETPAETLQDAKAYSPDADSASYGLIAPLATTSGVLIVAFGVWKFREVRIKDKRGT